MKKILLALCLVSPTFAFAQDGISLQPQVGIGLGSTYVHGYKDFKGAFIFDGILGVAYQHKHLVLNTGIGFLKTGYMVHIDYRDGLGNVIASVNSYSYIHHLLIPVTLGHEFTSGKKMKVIPAAGAGVTFNMSGTVTALDQSGNPKVVRMSSESFSRSYKRVGILGMVQVGFQYRLSEKMCITVAPGFDYMLTNIAKQGSVAPHPYGFLLNAGVKWSLAKPKKAEKKAAI